MGYLIRMAPEVGQWLAAVHDRDPAAAEVIDEAVAALRTGGESVGPPLVVPIDDRSLTARPDLDTAYERQLEILMHLRRTVADVATSRKRLELQGSQLEQQIGKLDRQSRNAMEAGRGDLAEEAGTRRGAAQEQLADVRRVCTDVQAEEGHLTAASQRLQARVHAFRIRKEAIKAARAAAQAAAELAWAEAVIGNAYTDTDADAEGAGSAADEALNAESPEPARPILPLSELRPGSPESGDTRILFTVEPPGTAVLLAAGMKDDWLRAWYSEAIASCRMRYQRDQDSTR